MYRDLLQYQQKCISTHNVKYDQCVQCFLKHETFCFYSVQIVWLRKAWLLLDPLCMCTRIDMNSCCLHVFISRHLATGLELQLWCCYCQAFKSLRQISKMFHFHGKRISRRNLDTGETQMQAMPIYMNCTVEWILYVELRCLCFWQQLSILKAWLVSRTV